MQSLKGGLLSSKPSFNQGGSWGTELERVLVAHKVGINNPSLSSAEGMIKYLVQSGVTLRRP